MKTFQYLLVIFSIVVSITTIQAQGSWGANGKRLEAKEFAGKDFRYSASVRTEIEDDSASARLWARVDLESGTGFFENMWQMPIRNPEWKTYTIEGTIDPGAAYLVFGTICQYNGKFYFDDFMVEVETEDNHWEQVFLYDFEKDTVGIEVTNDRWFGFRNGYNFKGSIISDNYREENKYLQVIGEGVPNYGINNEAGSFVDVNGIKMYYEIYGEGQPLVVLHGNGGSIENAGTHYQHFIDKGYKIIAVDSRAQGRSGDTDVELTYDLLASDINELLNELGIDSVFLWGHSDGAIVGLVIALKYPDKIKKLVAFAPNIVADTTGIEPPIYHFYENESLTVEDLKERKLASLIANHPNIPFSDLKSIKCEVLLMSSDRDFVPLRHTLEIFENIPNSNLCIIPGATHGAAWEKKDLFLQLVDEFFEEPFVMPDTKDWY